jgi:hypothetical protein
MNAKVLRSIAAYGDIVLFLKLHKIGGGRFDTARATLERCIVNIRELFPKQATARAGPKYDGITHRQLRATIRQDHMIPIARDGRALFRGEPAVLNVLKVPHAKANDAEVVTAANAMIKTLRPYAKLFTEIGYPKDFLKTLQDVTKQLNKWATHTAETRSRRIGANTELRDELRAAKDAAAVIDALMLGYARERPALAKHWKRARHVPKRLGRPRAAKVPSVG